MTSQSSYPEESMSEGTCSSTCLVPDFERKTFPCLVKVSLILFFDLFISRWQLVISL